jgi:hypothetical protein
MYCPLARRGSRNRLKAQKRLQEERHSNPRQGKHELGKSEKGSIWNLPTRGATMILKRRRIWTSRWKHWCISLVEPAHVPSMFYEIAVCGSNYLGHVSCHFLRLIPMLLIPCLIQYRCGIQLNCSIA